ncbi:MAG: hypothetical protein MJZ05_11160 [Fibrobacter sp.]|nr:hypothetical protein [Fibrobacter sp.]
MKKFILAATVALCGFIAGCMSEEPSISCGRDWNPTARVVVDTTSEFDLADQMIVQFKYGRNFDFAKLKTAFYEGTLANKGKEIWSREIPVTDKMDSYTLQGKSKHGGLMTARELSRQKQPGSVVVEFSADGNVIAQKEITLVKTR